MMMVYSVYGSTTTFHPPPFPLYPPVPLLLVLPFFPLMATPIPRLDVGSSHLSCLHEIWIQLTKLLPLPSPFPPSASALHMSIIYPFLFGETLPGYVEYGICTSSHLTRFASNDERDDDDDCSTAPEMLLCCSITIHCCHSGRSNSSSSTSNRKARQTTNQQHCFPNWKDYHLLYSLTLGCVTLFCVCGFTCNQSREFNEHQFVACLSRICYVVVAQRRRRRRQRP